MEQDQPSFKIAANGAQAAADVCDLPVHHIRQAVDRGDLIPRKVGRAWVFLISELQDWLASRPPVTRRKRRCPRA